MAQELDDAGALFDDLESFEQQRLSPFYETVMERRPDLAHELAPYLAQLRAEMRCLVHGDYAMKNMLVGRGRWVLDFEVAHRGNPVFDLGFFLSFVVLSAVRWPALREEMRRLSDRFLAASAATAGDAFHVEPPSWPVIRRASCWRAQTARARRSSSTPQHGSGLALRV